MSKAESTCSSSKDWPSVRSRRAEQVSSLLGGWGEVGSDLLRGVDGVVSDGEGRALVQATGAKLILGVGGSSEIEVSTPSHHPFQLGLGLQELPVWDFTVLGKLSKCHCVRLTSETGSPGSRKLDLAGNLCVSLLV